MKNLNAFLAWLMTMNLCTDSQSQPSSETAIVLNIPEYVPNEGVLISEEGQSDGWEKDKKPVAA